MAEALSPREAKFVAEVMNGAATEPAAVAAGWAPRYARKSAYKILQRPAVKAAIEQAQAKLKADSEMSAEKLLQMFVDAYAKAIEWKQSTGAVRAGEMIGKLTGLIQDKLKLEIEPPPSILGAIADANARVAAYLATSSNPQLIDITPNEPTPVPAAHERTPT